MEVNEQSLPLSHPILPLRQFFNFEGGVIRSTPSVSYLLKSIDNPFSDLRPTAVDGVSRSSDTVVVRSVDDADENLISGIGWNTVVSQLSIGDIPYTFLSVNPFPFSVERLIFRSKAWSRKSSPLSSFCNWNLNLSPCSYLFKVYRKYHDFHFRIADNYRIPFGPPPPTIDRPLPLVVVAPQKVHDDL